MSAFDPKRTFGLHLLPLVPLKAAEEKLLQQKAQETKNKAQ